MQDSLPVNNSESASNPPSLDSLLIALAAATLGGLIMIAQGRMTDKQFVNPMHSPNDRSRFDTIRAIGDYGTYAIDDVIKEPGWDTIDKVRRPGEDGHFYSSKPPLLPTLLAGEYWLLKHIPALSYSKEEKRQVRDQLEFKSHANAVVRIIVATANLLPFVVFLVLFARLLGQLTSDPWVRIYSLAAAGFGTYLTGFGVTLNNHTVAAFATFFALYPTIAIWRGDRAAWRFAVAGFFAGFAAVTELPATAFAAILGLGLLWKCRTKSLVVALPCLLVPVAGHVGTNWLVTGGLKPAYAHMEWYEFEGSYWKRHPETGRLVGTKTDPETKQVTFDDPTSIDNQYEDWWVYLFHLLVGHHGVFSLSPVFLLTLVGLARVGGWGRVGDAPAVNPSGRGFEDSAPATRVNIASHRDWLMPLALVTVALSIVLLAFYVIGPVFNLGQRNYGGMTNGPRWTFWLIPLWLVFVPIGLEPKAWCPWFRRIALVLLVVSVASAFYATRNPWTRPWIHELLNQAGVLPY